MARTTTIDHARAALTLLEEARAKLDRREHQALIALDIADAQIRIADIIHMMEQAKNGISRE